MKVFILLAALIISQSAMAGELVVVRGGANARKGGDLDVLYAKAKEDALSRLPTSEYTQVSKWGTYVVAIGPRLFVGAEASFVKEGDSTPHEITVVENRTWARTGEEVSEYIEKNKAEALEQGKFYCNSDVLQLTPWSIKTAPREGFPDSTNIEVAARFQCAEDFAK